MTEAIARSMDTIALPEIESNNLDYVKFDTDQKCIKITVKVARPGGFCSNEEIIKKAIGLWQEAKEKLEGMGLIVAPLNQSTK